MKAFLSALAAKTGARAQVQEGSTEAIIAGLEAGNFDLAFADLADDSPWINDVSFLYPFERHRLGERTLGFRSIARNGENQWIALLEKTLRDQGYGK